MKVLVERIRVQLRKKMKLGTIQKILLLMANLN